MRATEDGIVWRAIFNVVRRQRYAARSGALLLTAAASACGNGGLMFRDTAAGGADRYFILGFGVITIQQERACAPGASAAHAEALGLLVNSGANAGVIVGYGQKLMTTVNRNSRDLVIEVERRGPGQTTVAVRRTDPNGWKGGPCS
ncbi:MAG: hypothetical protein JNM29_10290 [Candidatus Odyssella sp.]|nr:hypothetical protein [Candidatus Odyssella sp.]